MVERLRSSPLWSSDYVPLPYGRATTFLSLMVESLNVPQFKMRGRVNQDWEERALLYDPVLDIILGGGGRVRTCSLQAP
jgi:hypothetical protein